MFVLLLEMAMVLRVGKDSVSTTQKYISWNELKFPGIYRNFPKLKKATMCSLDAHDSSRFAQHKSPF